jgi:fluoroacetyl-CoA thioesterase
MRQIPTGAKGSCEAVITPQDLANSFKDPSLPAVLATPVMIKLMENAALYAVQPYLDSNETALGTAISVRHLAATPAGRRVRAEAEVTHVDGLRIAFTVRARDEEREIGVGTHERAVIDTTRFAQRLAAQTADRAP